MNTLLQLYTVRIVRAAGQDEITGERYEYAEQTVQVNANTSRAAYEYARSVFTLPLYGHPGLVLINGTEYSPY